MSESAARRLPFFDRYLTQAVGAVGITRRAAFAAIVGPLVEVPVLIGLVNVVL